MFKFLQTKLVLGFAIVLVLMIFFVVIIIFFWKNENYINKITYLEDFKRAPYDLPIKSAKEAMNFFLDQEEVKREINKEGKWWVKASRSVPQNRESVWIVVLGDGYGECSSPYQCYMHINDDGIIKMQLNCSNEWTCE